VVPKITFSLTASVNPVGALAGICEKSWGKGFATEAAYICLEIARNHGEVQVVTDSASTDD